MISSLLFPLRTQVDHVSFKIIVSNYRHNRHHDRVTFYRIPSNIGLIQDQKIITDTIFSPYLNAFVEELIA